VDVRWRTAARTHERFNERILAVRVLAGRQEAIDVADKGDGATLLGVSDHNKWTVRKHRPASFARRRESTRRDCCPVGSTGSSRHDGPERFAAAWFGRMESRG
jgi:hypothetical protein